MKSARKEPSTSLSETLRCNHKIQKKMFGRKMKSSSYSPTYLLSFPHTYSALQVVLLLLQLVFKSPLPSETFYVMLLFPLVWPYIRT